MSGTPVIHFEELRREDVAEVGGKNSSLGELISQLSEAGVRVPPGFATTAGVYRAFLGTNDLLPMMHEALAAYDAGTASLPETGSAIRAAILKGSWPAHEAAAITRLVELHARDRLLDRPLAAVDMRLPDRLVVRMNPAPTATTPPINPTQVRSTRG